MQGNQPVKRTTFALKNISAIWAEKLVLLIVSFILQTVFIRALGAEYVGIDGLFTNVLSFLALSELGVGVAMTYSMYKPVSERNYEKIKSIMALYRVMYRRIAVIILLLGMAMLPFIHHVIKEPPKDISISAVYLAFLGDVSLSYLFTYRRSLLTANQQAYKYTMIDTVAKIIILGAESAVLLIFRNYYAYLTIKIGGNILENAYVSIFVTKVFPYLNEKNVAPLPAEEKRGILSNVKALFLHKFGDFAINSTDNLIISSFINVATVGIVSNYSLVISGINAFINNAFSALTASLGNLVVESTRERRLEMLEALNFCAFWLYGFASVGFLFLLNPLIRLWLGEAYSLPAHTVALIVISQYLTGMRVPLSTYKTSAGIYQQDQYIPLAQAAVNLAVSVGGVLLWGLPGVFIGTIASSVLVSSWNRPYTVYTYAFQMSCGRYFIKFALYAGFVMACAIGLAVLYENLAFQNKYVDFAYRLISASLLYHGFLILAFRKTAEYKQVKKLALTMFSRRRP